MSDKKVMKTMDGNEACATVAYHFTDVAGIYPICLLYTSDAADD